jgi:hypothetical protein
MFRVFACFVEWDQPGRLPSIRGSHSRFQVELLQIQPPSVPDCAPCDAKMYVKNTTCTALQSGGMHLFF